MSTRSRSQQRWYNPDRMTRTPFCMLVILLAGCMDASGNRVPVQNMFASKKPDHSQELAEVRAANHPKEQTPPKPKESGTDSKEISLDETSSPPGNSPKPVIKSSVPEPPANAVRAEGLIVDDETITVADILEPIQSQLPSMTGGLSAESYWRQVGELVRSQIIEAVAQHLIWRRAKQQLTDEIKPQVEKVVEKIEKERINREFGGRETAYEQYLAKHGRSREEIRQRLRRVAMIESYLRERLLPLVPQPRKAELYDYYQAHMADFSQPAKREMYLIDVPVAAFLDLTKPISKNEEEVARRKARQTIDDAVEALKHGDSFETVAKKYSFGLHKEDGGNWGWITEARGSSPLQGHWEVPSQKLFELKPGQTSDVIEAAKSYFLVKVGQIDPGKTQTFQQAQPEIANSLRQQGFMKLRAEFLQKELDRSTIGSLDDFLRSVIAAIQNKNDTSLTTEKDNYDSVPARSPRVHTDSKKPMIPSSPR